MKENFRKVLKYVVLGLFFGIISLGVHMCSNIKEDKHYKRTYVYKVYRQNLELKYYGAKDTLVDAIDTYIREIAPSSVMNAIAFVDKSDEHNFDLFFALAQAQCESSFSTKGLGHKMNSAFNVKAYDGKGSKYMDKEHHPDESIEPYMKLIKNDYLGSEKTEMDLMDNFVDLNGKRYATNPDYERMVLSTYKKLKENYGELYNEYLKYKTLCGK